MQGCHSIGLAALLRQRPGVLLPWPVLAYSKMKALPRSQWAADLGKAFMGVGVGVG
jgi:hypothetical protein